MIQESAVTARTQSVVFTLQEIQAKIWDPYFTTHKNRAGLGLSKVLLNVALNRGLINCASREQSGTTFTIRLPLIP